MPKVKVALIGVGNCASSFIQGIQYYSKTKDSIGLRNATLAGYNVGDIGVVAAFDVDARKVGLDLSEAIFAKPNNHQKSAMSPNSTLKCQRVRCLTVSANPPKRLSKSAKPPTSTSRRF
jgi:myo-inositol-1-phosphate synthase